jgi:hypothetical protein
MAQLLGAIDSAFTGCTGCVSRPGQTEAGSGDVCRWMLHPGVQPLGMAAAVLNGYWPSPECRRIFP